MACVLGAIVWFVEDRARLVGPAGTGQKVLGIVSEDVTSLSVEYGEFRVDCARRQGEWYIDRPLRARADVGELSRILNVLELLQRDEIITPSERANRSLSLQDYGLEPPRARFVLRGMIFRKELLVGRDAPLGESIYVKLQDGEGVISTSRSVLDIIPAKLDVLRDRTMIHGEAARTRRLEIQRPGVGFIQLAQTEKGWTIQQPTVARAEQARVDRMLASLYSLKVDKFIWDMPVREKERAEPVPDMGAQEELYDLVPDKAPARIGVWVARDRVGRELILGKSVEDKAEFVYAKLRDVESIYAVSKSILDVFSVTVNDLRDRKMFAVEPGAVNHVRLEEGDRKLVLDWDETVGWQISEPVRWKADDHVVMQTIRTAVSLRAEAFHGKQTNLAEIGLAPPAYTMQLLANPPAKGAPAAGETAEKERGRRNCILVAAMNPKDTAVYAKLDDDETVCTLRAGPVRGLVARLTDPLVYRDRTMLAVPVTSVKRISLTKGGEKQEIVLGEAGDWVPFVPATNTVDRKVVADVLFHFANMRALRIESHNPDSLAVYGLDRPTSVLTLGLAGEQGIQKSLMLGSRAKPDGVHAMVQGQDVVFVLSNEVVAELMRDISRPSGRIKIEPGDRRLLKPPAR